jgi:hypothetical protein
VRHEVDAELLAEIARTRLRFACEDCAQFDPETGLCSAGYPNAEHRLARPDPRVIIFCKEFELT